MDVLPITSPTPQLNGGQYRGSSVSSRIPVIFRRLLRFQSMVRVVVRLTARAYDAT